jgi:hypothetical protein
MSVQKNLCQFVLYLVGNCINLCQFGEGFLLVNVALQLMRYHLCPKSYRVYRGATFFS